MQKGQSDKRTPSLLICPFHQAKVFLGFGAVSACRLARRRSGVHGWNACARCACGPAAFADSPPFTIPCNASSPCVSPAALLYYHQGPRRSAFLICCCNFRGVAERPVCNSLPPCRQRKPPDCRFQAVFRGFSCSAGQCLSRRADAVSRFPAPLRA